MYKHYTILPNRQCSLNIDTFPPHLQNNILKHNEHMIINHSILNLKRICH